MDAEHRGDVNLSEFLNVRLPERVGISYPRHRGTTREFAPRGRGGGASLGRGILQFRNMMPAPTPGLRQGSRLSVAGNDTVLKGGSTSTISLPTSMSEESIAQVEEMLKGFSIQIAPSRSASPVGSEEAGSTGSFTPRDFQNIHPRDFQNTTVHQVLNRPYGAPAISNSTTSEPHENEDVTEMDTVSTDGFRTMVYLADKKLKDVIAEIR